jgi:hypothetical protein
MFDLRDFMIVLGIAMIIPFASLAGLWAAGWVASRRARRERRRWARRDLITNATTG